GGYLFERSMAALTWASETVERRLGTRRFQPQLRLIVLTALLAGTAAALTGGFVVVWPEFRTPQAHNLAFAALWLVGGACAVAAAWQAKYHRLAAVALMGGAGLASCLTFVWLSAPDLALTQ